MKRKSIPRIPKITKLPSGAWHTNVMVDGKRISVTDKDYGKCMAAAMDLVSNRLKGAQPSVKRSKTVSLRDALNMYINSRDAVLSPSTIRGYKKIRDLRFQSVMDSRLCDINDWQYVVNEEAKLCSAKTLKNAWGLIKSVLKKNGIADPDVTIPQVVDNEHPFLQPDQIPELLELIKGEKYELVYLLGLHGLRSSEILGLDVEKNLTKDVIRIRGSKVQTETAKGAVKYVSKKETKTEKSRRDVPVMIPRIKELVKEMKKSGTIDSAIPDHPEAARKRLNRICKNNGLPEIGLHGLRHTFASLCYHLGLSEMETMRLGGWSDPMVMRKIYTHLAEKDKQNAEMKLKRFFEDGDH